MSELTDEQLVHAYRSGDRAAFDLLVSRYAHSLYYFIYGYVRDASQAEDSTQDVFLKLWKHIGRFDEKQKFKTWIFFIAKNTALDVLKKKRTVPFSAFQNDDANVSWIETIEDPEVDVESIIEQQYDEGRIAAAIDLLPHIYRTVIFLRYREDMTFREMADILDESVDTLKSRHRRALVRLRTLLDAPDAANAPSMPG